MTDFMTKAARSRLMSRIKGKDTKPEMRVRRYLHARGLRYSLHKKSLPGKPDLVFTRHRTVLFVHGCFWHRHPGCSKAYLPKKDADWWKEKLEGNVARDRRNIEKLEADGWRVLVIWECETKSETALLELAGRIRSCSDPHPRCHRRSI